MGKIEGEQTPESKTVTSFAEEADQESQSTVLPDTDRDDKITGPKLETFSQTEIFKALEIVERDSVAVAQSFTSLFDSLRLALSQATSSSVDHMHCFGDAAGRIQEAALDAATKGNRYMNSCVRLNEEMKGIDTLATKLKVLRKNVDALDSAVNRICRLP